VTPPETAKAGALVADGVSVSLGGRRVLENVRFSAPRGRVTGVLGANGAGKSTLLRLLAGLLKPERGDVRLEEGALASLDVRERARRIGFVPQSADCHWPITCRMVVELGRMPHTGTAGGGSEEDRAAVERAMQAMQVEGLAERPATAISGGELRRVQIARALATEPEFLLLDEPTAGLDPYHQLHLMALLAQLAKEGHGLVTTLHDIALAARFCDQVVILDKGRVAAFGPPSEALQPAILRACYGIDAHLEWRDGEPLFFSRLPSA
jgi:iron complex transport system ATP-binding protein